MRDFSIMRDETQTVYSVSQAASNFIESIENDITISATELLPKELRSLSGRKGHFSVHTRYYKQT